MQKQFGCVQFMLTTCLLGVSAQAAEPQAKATATGSEAASPTSSVKAHDVPRDPKGIKGISPFWEAVGAGDMAMRARDVDTAVQHYQEALKVEAQNPVGHYRMGEAHKVKGDLAAAQTSLEAAVRFAGQDASTKAKALFSLAALAERQNRFPEAQALWKRYVEHTRGHRDVKGFPASATERLQRIETHERLTRDNLQVKERIKKREADVTAKVMSGSK